jgi:hypothetical protein
MNLTRIWAVGFHILVYVLPALYPCALPLVLPTIPRLGYNAYRVLPRAKRIFMRFAHRALFRACGTISQVLYQRPHQSLNYCTPAELHFA